MRIDQARMARRNGSRREAAVVYRFYPPVTPSHFCKANGCNSLGGVRTMIITLALYLQEINELRKNQNLDDAC
jgi:hypothetical protein